METFFGSILFSSLLMGFFGGPPCIAMCGGVCNFFANQSKSMFFLFQLGRLLGYGLLGIAAAILLTGIYNFFQYSIYLQPIRVLFHIFFILWGGYLIIYLKQPPFLNAVTRKINQFLSSLRLNNINPFFLGILWSLMPCALLYTALILTTMAVSITQGFLIMISFGIGTLFSLVSLSLIWVTLKDKIKSYESTCIRIAGFILVVCSIWGMMLTFKGIRELIC